MKSILIGLAVCLALAGCTKAPTGGTVTKGEFNVAHLFTVDGCAVYRFMDAGQSVYFTKCEGASSSSAIPIQNCGKSCHRAESNETSYGDTDGG